MKKIVYFITVFTMLCGGDSEARLPKSQGQMAAALLMQKAGLTINIPTDWTQANHDTKVGELMGNNVYKFIIDTIYTTDGRNEFADWMKNAYKNCTYTTNGKTEWKKYDTTCYYNNSVCTNHSRGYKQCQGKAGEQWYNSSYPGDHNYQIAGITLNDANEKAEVIKLANALFPCWTGTFTAFFINGNCDESEGKQLTGSKGCWKKAQDKGENTTDAVVEVIGAGLQDNKLYSGAPSLWVLSANNPNKQAERYNAILSQCNNIVEKILWLMFVLETVDDTNVIKELIKIGQNGEKLSTAQIRRTYGSIINKTKKGFNITWPTVTTVDYDVVPVPNTFCLADEYGNLAPRGTCIISTILNLLNISGRLDKESDAKISFPNRPSKETIPGLTRIQDFISSNSIFDEAVKTTSFETFVNILKKFITGHGGLQQDNYEDIIAKALCLDNKNVTISTSTPTEVKWNDRETMTLTDINGKDVTIRFGLSSELNSDSYHMEIVDIKQTEK